MQACIVASTLWWGAPAEAAPEATSPPVEAVAPDDAELADHEAGDAEAGDAEPGSVDAEAPPTAEDGSYDDGIEEEPEPSPWSAGLLSSLIALAIGGTAAVLGIWVDRDTSRPTVFAGAMSVLIASAVFVGMVQSYLDAVGAIQARADLDRMLDMVAEISADSDDPALAALVEEENQKRRRRRPTKP